MTFRRQAQLVYRLLVTLWFSVAAWTQGDMGPTIEFKQLDYNLGKLLINAKTTVNIPFVNTGTGDLLIEKVQSDCGCLVAELAKRQYAAGEEGKITLAFTFAGKFKQKVTRKVLVKSNDTSHPVTEITVEAEGAASLRYSPQALEFGELNIAQERLLTILVSATQTDAEFKILGVTSTVPGIDTGQIKIAKLEKKVPDPDFKNSLYDLMPYPVYEIGVTAKFDSAGLKAGTIRISTSNQETGAFELPVHAKVRGNVVAVPSSLVVVARGERTVHLRLEGQDKFRIIALESDWPEIRLKAITEGESSPHELEISIPEDNGRDSNRTGTIRVQFEYEGSLNEIAVPYAVYRIGQA